MKHIRKLEKKEGFSYRVRFCINYKEITIGTFTTEKEAIIKRDKAYSKYGIVNKVQKNLTQKQLHTFVHYNANNGIFTRKNRSGNAKIGDQFNTVNGRGYIEMSFNNQFYKAHRLAFLYMDGKIPKNIDHINGNTADNAWINLRNVTNSENSKNAKLRKDNKYGIIGISKDSNGSWRARISNNFKEVILLYQGSDFFEACCKRRAAEKYYNYHVNHGRTK